MNRSELQARLQAHLRYKRAPSWRKPWIDPRRFAVNQLRRLGLLRERLGELRTTATFHFPSFTIVNGEGVSEQIGSYGVYEETLTEAFLRLVHSGDVIVDIGMHLGYYTTLFGVLVGENGEVHAFEPTPSTRSIAAHNLTQLPHVRVHPFAVWSSEGKLTFRDYGVQWMAFNSYREAKIEQGPPEPSVCEVESIPLDSFRRSLARSISLIKIDAESAEEQILLGAGETLALDHPLVSLEVGDAREESSSRRCVDRLLGLGYHPWEFAGGEFVRHQPRDRYGYDNLIFAPAGRELSGR